MAALGENRTRVPGSFPSPTGGNDTGTQPRGPPSPPPRKRPRAQVRLKAQVRRGEGPHLPQLPPEIILRIFQAAVEGEGAVPFLCRVSRVCRLWRDLAADPRLWLRVHLRGHLRAHLGGPARGRRPPPEQVLSPLLRLVESRFSLLQEFVLCDWSNHVGPVLQALSTSCPHLRHLELRRCQVRPGPTWGGLGSPGQILGDFGVTCRIFWGHQVEPAALGAFLAAPPPLQHLHLTCARLRGVLPALAAGLWPQLRVLELDQSLGGPGPPLPLPLERLQRACPDLQVCLPLPPQVCLFLCPSPTGGVCSFAPPPDRCSVSGALFGSPSAAPPPPPDPPPPSRTCGNWGWGIPAGALSRLSLPVSPGCPPALSPVPSVALSWLAVTRRWHRTLLELDLSGRRDPDLGGALSAFGPRDPLRVLRVAGTHVTAPEL
ncbi:F-box/LRR-repeat protein 6, partial [Cinclus cinclus]|uniref:F-box/LRR-repeat protein 6 n=1 Tax=Cinclus cinclus TaxID=127875 RepID=UPI002E112400